MLKNVKALIRHLSSRRKFQAFSLLLLMLVTAILEIISIGAVIPFISALTQPQSLMNISFIAKINDAIGITSTTEFAFYMTAFFCIISVLAALIKLLYQWVQVKFSTAISTDLGKLCFRNILSLSFYRNSDVNSGDLISTIFVKINLVLMQVIIPFFSIISSFILIFGIFFGLLLINHEVTLILFGSFAVSYLLSSQILKQRMYSHGDSVNENQNVVIKNLQNAFGSIKEIILGNMQKFYMNIFEDSDYKLKSSQSKLEFYKVAPRYFVELFMMSIFAILAYQILSIDDESKFNNLAFLSALALTAVKVFPIVQNIFSNWFSIQSHQKVFQDVIERLETNGKTNNIIESYSKFDFKSQISVKNVTYKPNNKQEILLKNINLKINKGQKVLITGKTGSGKSTLVDLIMGLISPSSGHIEIDNQLLNDENVTQWQALIGHVPQSIFMFNKNVIENIAIAERFEKISKEHIKRLTKITSIHNEINNWSEGYLTTIGEGGKKISGGEAQRIGIARALYRDPSILIFDEATNSVDLKTEKIILQNIFSEMEDKTMIFISHQLDNADFFDLLINLDQGEVKNLNEVR